MSTGKTPPSCKGWRVSWRHLYKSIHARCSNQMQVAIASRRARPVVSALVLCFCTYSVTHNVMKWSHCLAVLSTHAEGWIDNSVCLDRELQKYILCPVVYVWVTNEYICNQAFIFTLYIECQTCSLLTCQTSMYQLDTHTYVHKNDDNDTGEMNQIWQICSAQDLAQQSMLVVWSPCWLNTWWQTWH